MWNESGFSQQQYPRNCKTKYNSKSCLRNQQYRLRPHLRRTQGDICKYNERNHTFLFKIAMCQTFIRKENVSDQLRIHTTGEWTLLHWYASESFFFLTAIFQTLAFFIYSKHGPIFPNLREMTSPREAGKSFGYLPNPTRLTKKAHATWKYSFHAYRWHS